MPPLTRSPVGFVLADLADGLGRLGVDWYLFGAQAATLRGLRRTTVDVDVTAVGVALDGESLTRGLGHAFALRVPDAEEFVRATRVLPLVHRATGIDVDLVLGGPGLESWFLERCESIAVEGTSIRVPCVDDLVLMKLIAGRPRDLEDVIELVAFDPGATDLARLREVLREIETGIGESGLVAALDVVEQRLARERSRPKRKRAAKRPK